MFGGSTVLDKEGVAPFHTRLMDAAKEERRTDPDGLGDLTFKEFLDWYGVDRGKQQWANAGSWKVGKTISEGAQAIGSAAARAAQSTLDFLSDFADDHLLPGARPREENNKEEEGEMKAKNTEKPKMIHYGPRMYGFGLTVEEREKMDWVDKLNGWWVGSTFQEYLRETGQIPGWLSHAAIPATRRV